MLIHERIGCKKYSQLLYPKSKRVYFNIFPQVKGHSLFQIRETWKTQSSTSKEKKRVKKNENIEQQIALKTYNFRFIQLPNKK